MSITLPLSLLFIQKFLGILFCLTLLCSVNCVRSSSSSAESTGASGPSPSASSLIPTSSNSHHHHRGDRELISAQFRAVQDGRDLDTSESSASIGGLGLDSLAAAAAAAAAGLEDDPLALSKYMSASASAYPPTKIARLNRYTQSGFYDPYPSYAPAALNSIPSSYYPYNAYSTYRDTNPMLDTYPYYERDRIRDLRERAMQAQAAQSSPQYSNSISSSSSNRDGYSGGLLNGIREGFRSSDQDNTAMSSGHHHDEGHGHGGWGWGMYTSKVNTNAIGLLGLLGLLSLLSNVLMQFTTTTTTTTTMAAARIRKKRSPFGGEVEDAFESREQRRERVFMEILPHLTPVAHAKDGVIPLECTFHGVCMANKVLVNEFGLHGRAGGMRISSAIVKLLEKVSNATENGIQHHKKPSDKASKYSYTGKNSLDIKKKLESAGLDGRNKKDCQKSYPVCAALRSQVMPRFPFEIRMQDLPQLISKANKMTLATAAVDRRANRKLNGVPMTL